MKWSGGAPVLKSHSVDLATPRQQSCANVRPLCKVDVAKDLDSAASEVASGL